MGFYHLDDDDGEEVHFVRNQLAMDLGNLIAFIFIIACIVICIRACCCSNRRGVVLSAPAPPVVTTNTQPAPTLYPTAEVQNYFVPVTNYPRQQPQVTVLLPTAPVTSMPPLPLPTTTYQSEMPGMQQYSLPYPTGDNPPPYNSVVNNQADNPLYGKQMPYNPNYQQ